MEILNGKKVSEEIKEALKERISSSNLKPKMAVIQVGNREDSSIYIRNKKKFGEYVGAEVNHINLDEEISEEDLINEIEKLNEDKSVNGIIVQLPLPESIDSKKVLNSVSLEKDIDGLREESRFKIVTTRGVITLLQKYNIEISGKKVVVMGQSEFVGKPTLEAFKELGADVVGVDVNTENIKDITKTADILVVAIGSPEKVDSSYIKEGVVIVDIGINMLEGNLVGDVNFLDIKDKVSYITPVPGGVGPMTVASLFENLVDATQNQKTTT